MEHLLFRWIIQSITFGSHSIFEENTLPRLRIQFLFLIFVFVCKGFTPENLESVHSWSFSCPSFIQSHSSDCFGRASVTYIRASGEGFSPKLFGKFVLTNIHVELAVSTRVRFICSTTPFCSGVFGIMNLWHSPSVIRCASNFL